MNSHTSLFQRFLESRLLVSIIPVMVMAPAGAQTISPYTVDSNTLHLWHFDEASPGPVAPDSGLTGSFDLVPDGGKSGNPATLEAVAFEGFGLAGDTTAGSGAGFKGDAIAITGATGPDGAFTFEAMVRTSTMTDSQQIVSMEGNVNNTQRPFQFRIANGNLLFINISAGLAAGSGTLNLSAAIPDTGPDAFVADEWFHVAATYNGDEASAADNFKLYWTRVDPSRTAANEIGSFVMNLDLVGDTLAFGAGNDYRTFGTGNGSNLEGQIDEVRISDIARAPDDMLFGNSSAGPEFAITRIAYSPLTSLVTLTWSKSAAGLYAVKYSPDLISWDGDLDDGIIDADDEDPDDSGQITVTFKLAAGVIGAENKLFFRVEGR